MAIIYLVNTPYDVPSIANVEMYAKENASNHRTDKYELVTEQNVPVLRRGDAFYLAIKANNRALDPDRDRIKINFEFGNILNVLSHLVSLKRSYN